MSSLLALIYPYRGSFNTERGVCGYNASKYQYTFDSADAFYMGHIDVLKSSLYYRGLRRITYPDVDFEQWVIDSISHSHMHCHDRALAQVQTIRFRYLDCHQIRSNHCQLIVPSTHRYCSHSPFSCRYCCSVYFIYLLCF